MANTAKRVLAMALILVMMLGLFAGCSKSTAENEQTNTTAGNTTTEVRPEAASAAETADEGTTATETSAAKILRMSSAFDFKSAMEGKTLVFETLVVSDMAGNFSPWLAEEYEISDDGMVYTFHLRHDVLFHDGTVFNAEVAKFSLDFACETSTLGNYVESVNIIDDYTVEMVFHTYLYTVLYTLSSSTGFMITDSDVVDGKFTGWNGTGPFIFVEDTYEKNVKADLVRFDDYWNGATSLDGIAFMYIPDPNAMVVALESDEVDVIGITEHHSSIPYVQISALKAEGYNVQTDETGRYQVIDYNCTRAPFDDANVRMAFNLAFNREEMVETLFEGMTEPANVITAPWFVDGPDNVDVDYYKYDIDRAQALLDEAGWVDSDGDGIREKDGQKLEATLLVPNGEANADMVAVYLQSEMQKIGAVINVKNLESSAASELRSSGDFDMYVHHSGCLSSFPGGINIGGKYYSGASGWTYAFHSEELDAMIEEAFTNPDADTRNVQIDEIWTYLHAQAPCMPLYSVKKLVAMNPRVSGYHTGFNMFDMLMCKDMDMDMSK